MDVKIIPMGEDDVVAVSAIENECFSDPWSEASFTESLVNPAFSFFVAVDESYTVIGYAGIAAAADESELINIAVKPEHRKNGIGHKLIEYAEAEAVEKGAKVMYLEVRESNTPAKSLYASHGFEEIGIRKNYYEKPRENAVIMMKHI